MHYFLNITRANSSVTKNEFWIMTVHLDIGDIEILFANGGEGKYLPIMRMPDDEIPDEVPGY